MNIQGDRANSAGLSSSKSINNTRSGKRGEESLPTWALITGVDPKDKYSGADRRARLRHLYKLTVNLIRRELLAFERDPNKDERTIFWEPTAEVCAWLEIAPSKLSTLLKEFNGNSLANTIDCVKVERVRKMLRAELKGAVERAVKAKFFVKGPEKTLAQLRGGQQELGASLSTREKVMAVWRVVKEERRAAPEFSLNTWAYGLGFSSYRRFYRACVAAFRKGPQELVFEIIAEMLDCKAEVQESDEVTLEAVEELVKGFEPYDWKVEEVRSAEFRVQNSELGMQSVGRQ